MSEILQPLPAGPVLQVVQPVQLLTTLSAQLAPVAPTSTPANYVLLVPLCARPAQALQPAAVPVLLVNTMHLCNAISVP